MARLVINSLAELKSFQQKIKVMMAAFPLIQTNAVLDVAQNDILAEMKKKMNFNNFSQKIIDATFVGPIVLLPDKVQVHYISNYVAPENNFDVSEAREEGTRDHDVRPRKKGGSLRWFADTGEPIFAKKSHPAGIERLLIIERTIKENESEVDTLYGESIAESASKVFGV